jgi:hypothetical protein
MGKLLYAGVTNVSDIISVIVSSSHSASTSTAQIITRNKTVNIGDNITIDLGYEDDYDRVFKGYVKNITRNVPTDIYTIVAKDDLVRALDFFIVPTDPDDSYRRSNITAEALVEDVLEMAGITNFTYTPTNFTFATRSGNEVEVKLTSSYDFCKMIADLLTWHLWADEDGLVHFENRKPHVMYGTSGQPGDVADVAINAGSPITNTVTLNTSLSESDHDLRNRVVVHGATGVYADAESDTSYNPLTDAMEQIMPVGFHKSMALLSPIIDNQSMAQITADYNLDLYNKLTVSASLAVEGDPALLARRVIEVDEDAVGLSGNWYIYSSEMQWSREGFITTLDLRK